MCARRAGLPLGRRCQAVFSKPTSVFNNLGLSQASLGVHSKESTYVSGAGSVRGVDKLVHVEDEFDCTKTVR